MTPAQQRYRRALAVKNAAKELIHLGVSNLPWFKAANELEDACLALIDAHGEQVFADMYEGEGPPGPFVLKELREKRREGFARVIDSYLEAIHRAHPLMVLREPGRPRDGDAVREFLRTQMSELEGSVIIEPTSAAGDTVDRPAHYDGDECMQKIEEAGLGVGFCLGSAVKYLWRQGRKHNRGGEDVQKARWYIERCRSYSLGFADETLRYRLKRLCKKVLDLGAGMGRDEVRREIAEAIATHMELRAAGDQC